MPDAQACTLCSGSEVGEQFIEIFSLCASPLLESDQFSEKLEGAFVAGAFSFFCNGLALSVGNGTIRRAESGQSETLSFTRRLALVQRKGTYSGNRR